MPSEVEASHQLLRAGSARNLTRRVFARAKPVAISGDCFIVPIPSGLLAMTFK
ncbi:MAG: hypothetical protein AABY78_02940 [Nitrospirota bacterium]